MTILVLLLLLTALVLLVEYARADTFSGRPRTDLPWRRREPGHRER